MTLQRPVRPVSSSEPPLTVADALVDSLVGWQVEALYGVSGANIEHLHDAVHRRGLGRLRSVAARSEVGAAFMADAHARLRGSLGVCCSTSGGGMMNLAVGVAECVAVGEPFQLAQHMAVRVAQHQAKCKPDHVSLDNKLVTHSTRNLNVVTD